MRFIQTIAAAAAIATASFAATSFTTSASAAKWGADYYRVVEVSGAETLALRSGPASWSGIVVEVPFDTRDLRGTGVTQGNWIQLTYRTEHGSELTGWARATHIALDNDESATLYRVVGLGRHERLEVRKGQGYGRVLGTVSSRYAALRGAGDCEDGYCPVRYTNRRGTFIGWVEQANIAVTRASTQYADDQAYDTVTIEAETTDAVTAPEATPTVWQPKRRGFLWRLFNPEMVLEGY